MTVTFDDLPYVAIDQQGLPKARRATTEMLRILKAHRVPVVAFVNEGYLQVAGEERGELRCCSNGFMQE